MSDVVVPDTLQFSSTHEWIQIDDKLAVIGITHYAAELLGEIVFVELPHVNSDLQSGDACGVIESVKAATDFCLPLSGRVIAINTALEENPSLINQQPYQQGWLVKIELTDPEQQHKLLDRQAYLTGHD